jgi:hypothetical protein
MATSTEIPVLSGRDDEAGDRDDRPKVRIGSHGGSYGNRGEMRMDIHGLDSRELELMKGAMHGHQWVTCKGGRIKHVPAYEPLPDPAEDEAMTPFWRRPAPEEGVQLSLFPFEPVPVWASPSISISHLCGYHYSEERYAIQAKNLTRWGFVCLRSQRDDSGQFYEQWHLPGLWAAKEELKAAIDALDPHILDKGTAKVWVRDRLGPPRKKQKPPKNEEERQKRALDTAISFLCREAQFGTLDVSVQRAAMAIPD